MSRKDKTYLDIEEILGEHGWSVINGDTGAVELAAEHLSGDGHAEDITCELDVGLEVVDVGGAFENLYQLVGDYLPGRQRACRRFRGLDPFSSCHRQVLR